MMKIIVGLGNPGEEYADTYHNVGVQALHAIVEGLSGGDMDDGAGTRAAWKFKKYKHLFEYVTVGNLVFVRPLTFMNNSGLAVKEALKKFNADAQNLIVLHDESDLTVGSYKVSKDRGTAGHKGVQSVIDALTRNDFTRIRIGIRPAKEVTRKKAEEFVLSPIRPRDRATLKKVFTLVAQEIAE